VAFLPNGNLVVADTWNFRISVYSPQGEFLYGFGQPGTFGAAAPVEPTDGFWGPRDVEVDADGNIYVADTGNKRVRVYDSQGSWLRDIGSAGSQLGQLDEPAGLAISADGRLFVADTWNRRISVFALDGTPLYTFDVRAWYEDLGNRPYLAIDDARNLLYVGDPDSGRVLVYDTQGSCIGSFGQPADAPMNTQFTVVGGIDVDAAGNVYIADAGSNRLLRFPPFISEPVVPPAASDANSGAASEGGVEMVPVNQGNALLELTAEATAESPAPAEGTQDASPAG
jgi:DNA-binding beta-propeller fold protein YncE